MVITTDLKRRRDCDDITREEKKLKQPTTTLTRNSTSNKPHTHPAQHKSFHLNPYNLNIPNIQKPPPPPLSPLTPSKLFSRSLSENRFQPSTSRNHPRAKSVSKEDRQGLNAIFFCSDPTYSPIIDHHIKKTRTPITTVKTIENTK